MWEWSEFECPKSQPRDVGISAYNVGTSVSRSGTCVDAGALIESICSNIVVPFQYADLVECNHS